MAHSEQFADLRLVRKIASGGMGEVWEAYQLGPHHFEKRLAVKKILSHLTKDKEFVNMFLDEGRLVAYLDHPNICQVFRMGVFENVYYMEMEYVEGYVLTDVIDKASRRGVLIPLEHCCQILLGVCAGLGYAHSRMDHKGNQLGIVHRDVSPPNIMISTDGFVKILDFGIAKAKSHIQLTEPGLLKGKLGYVAPEQINGEEIDARIDIFSIGVVLWEMLTCRRLFHGEEELAILHKISRGHYQSPSTYREDIPPELEWIVMKALAPRPSERFQTCAELEQALEEFLFHFGVPAGNRSLARFLHRLFSDLPVEAAVSSEKTAVHQKQTVASVSSKDALSSVATSLTNASGTASFDSLEASVSLGGASIVNAFHVLVVDDDEAIRDVVSMILRSNGYKVELARHGLEAIEKVKEKPFDVCILDLDMPHLDGRGALEEIRKLQPSLPCVIQTANRSFQMATEMGRRGAVTYLLKPARRKAVLEAIAQALRHRPSGSAFESIWLSDFPTPLADIRIRYRELSDRLEAAKSKHAMLAVQFHLFSSWIGALALSCYRKDGAFCPRINRQFLTSLGMFHPSVWLSFFRDILLSYQRSNRDVLFHTLRNVFAPSSWDDAVGHAALESLFETIVPLLSEPVSRTEQPAWDAMMVLSQYHSGMWRHDVMLDDAEVMRRVEVLEQFLTCVFERSFRVIDYNLVRIDGLNASADGILHDMTVFRGSSIESRTCLFPETLEASAFYLFDLTKRPLVKLSPFVISSPCFPTSCHRSSLAFPVQLNPSGELFFRCLSCGLLKRPGALVQYATKQLFDEFQQAAV